jgi:hypothetical protein
MFKGNKTKTFINNFLAARAGPPPRLSGTDGAAPENGASTENGPTRALVIDADKLSTSRTLMKAGVPPENITVLNSDQTICDRAKTLGMNALCGISTLTIRELIGDFDIVYLDYCGFPGRHANGFDAYFDLLWAADHLTPSGIVLATFSRRATKCIETAESMIPNSLQLAKTYVYHETCAMMCMFMVKENPRALRDSINRALLAPAPEPHPKVPKVPKVRGTRKRKKRDMYQAGPSVRPKKAKLIGASVSVQWGNEILPGKVVKKVRGGYDVYFPETNEIAIVKRNAIYEL